MPRGFNRLALLVDDITPAHHGYDINPSDPDTCTVTRRTTADALLPRVLATIAPPSAVR